MNPAFTPIEHDTLTELRDLVSKVAGISIVDDYITIRFGKTALKQVTMRIDSIDCADGFKECFQCGEGGYDFVAARMTIQTSSEPIIRRVKLCHDCYTQK